MKKIIAYILAALIITTNVYGSENWFVLLPNIDSEGEKVSSEDYKDLEGVKIEFKIVEIIKDIFK